MKLLRILLIITIVFLLSLSGGFGYFVYTVTELEALPEAVKPLTTRIYDAEHNLIALRYAKTGSRFLLKKSPQVYRCYHSCRGQAFLRPPGFDLSGVARQF